MSKNLSKKLLAVPHKVLIMDDETYVFADSKQTADVECYYTKHKNLVDYADKFKLTVYF